MQATTVSFLNGQGISEFHPWKKTLPQTTKCQLNLPLIRSNPIRYYCMFYMTRCQMSWNICPLTSSSKYVYIHKDLWYTASYFIKDLYLHCFGIFPHTPDMLTDVERYETTGDMFSWSLPSSPNSMEWKCLSLLVCCWLKNLLVLFAWICYSLHILVVSKTGNPSTNTEVSLWG